MKLPITLEDKINALEYYTGVHYAAYQFVECGLLKYFSMLRRGENIDFFNDLHTHDDLFEYSYVVRDTHQKTIDE